MKPLLLSIFCSLAAAVAFAQTDKQPPQPQTSISADPLKDIRIVLHTDKGDIEGTLFATQAPITVANFLNLVQRKYYDGLKFHRVIPSFMIQGGDPQGTGSGGPGYQFEDEFVPSLRFDKPGVFAMANRGANTNGSQFFITHVPTPHLNGKHTIFGQVTKGQEVVNAIQQNDKIKSIDVLDSTKALFDLEKSHIADWDKSVEKGKR
jgi:peptidyl-prolyl cis-trans isomerase B (cyclophilin B)